MHSSRAEVIVSPSTGARRAAVAAHAVAVGEDFELRVGHHLGEIDARRGPS